MPINKSYGQEMDKRTRELDKRSPGSGSQALQEQQLAQNQLQAIQNEQRSNLMSQRTEAAAMAQQNQLLSQAAELGVSDSTAATLGKYGMKTPPRVQRQQGRQVSVTPNKITIVNNTNTTTTNNVQQGSGGGGDNGSAAKFKTWLGKVNMQQAEQASKRDRDYARRESSLTRSANKMLRRIEKVGSSVAESFSPQSFGQTLGSQLKMYLLIFGMKFLTKYWDKVLYMIDWIGKKFEDFTAWLGIGDRGKTESAQGRGLIPTVIRLLGGDPGRESVSDAFKNSLKAAFDHFSLKLDHMMAERAEAMKKVKLNVNADGALGGILKGLGLESLFQGVTTYLGDILTVLVNPKAGAAKQVSRNIQKKGLEGSMQHLNTGQHDNAAFGVDKGALSTIDKNNKGRYGLIDGAVGPGNILTSKAGGQVSQSLDVIGALRDARETGYVDPARFLAGLERMQNKARTSGFIAVDYEFLTTFLSVQSIKTLTSTGHIRLRKYKAVKVRKSDAHGMLDYVKGAVSGGLWQKGANLGYKAAAKGVGYAAGHTTRVGLTAAAGTAAKAGLAGISKALGPVGWAVGGAAITAIEDYRNNDYTLELVPIDDPQESFDKKVYVLYEIDEYVLKQIAQQFGGNRFDTSSEKMMKQAQRYINQWAGGYAATKSRWKGKGSNTSINIDSEYKSIHEMDNLQRAHKKEEDNDEFNRRLQSAKNEGGRIVDNVIDAGKDAYQSTKDFFVKPTGASPKVLYSPEGYEAKAGYGPRTANAIEHVPAPVMSKYGEISYYLGNKGSLKSPTSTNYTFYAKSAVDEASKLSHYIITSKPRKDWKPKSPTVRAKGGYLAKYSRLAIAKGLGKTDLKDRPYLPCELADILYKYGFCPVNWEGYSPHVGDICIFGPTPNFKGGYVSIFSGNKWISDHEQLDIWPDDEFKSNRVATIFRHLRIISDKTQGESLEGLYGAGVDPLNSPDSFGYVDFNGDGKYDAMKTPDGVYKLKEDGTLGDKITPEELSSLVNSSTNYLDYNSLTSVGSGGFAGSGYGGGTESATFTLNGLSGYNTEWQKAVYIMKSWFERNVHEYKQATTFSGCTILGNPGFYRKDCSGFVSACLALYGVPVYDPTKKGSWPPASAAYTQNGGYVEKIMLSNGFSKLPFPGLDKVQPFDIMTKDGHIEIYAGQGLSYSWGRVHDLKTPIGRSTKQTGMPSYTAKMNYAYIYRCTGKTSNTGNNSLIKTIGDSLTIEGGTLTNTTVSDFSAGSSSSTVSTGSGGGNIYGWNLSSSNTSGGGGYVGNTKITSGQAKQNAISMVNFLMSKGLTREQALGIAGNLMAESGFNPNAIGDRGTSGGFAQWHNERFTNLQNFAKARGKHWTDPNIQAEFLWHELTEGGYKNVLTKIKGAGTKEEAAKIWGRYFEGFKGSNDYGNSEYSKRIGFARSIGGEHSGTSKEISFVGGGDETTQALGQAFETAEDLAKKAAASVQTTYNDVKLAIKNKLPTGNPQFVTLDKDLNKAVEVMSEDQLAAQIWLNNEMIRSQYDSYGFEGWKKNVFDKLPNKKAKQRYLVESEAQALFAGTSTSSDGTGKFWTGLQNIIGDKINPKYYDSLTGSLTNEGLTWFSRVYSTLSPKERTNLVQRLKLEKDWHDTVNDIDNKFSAGEFTEDEIKNLQSILGSNISLSGYADPDGNGIYSYSDIKDSEFAKRIYKNFQLGNLSEAREDLLSNIRQSTNSSDPLKRALVTKFDTHYFDNNVYNNLRKQGAVNDILARAFAKEQYDLEQEKINKFVSSDNYKRFRDFLFTEDLNDPLLYNLIHNDKDRYTGQNIFTSGQYKGYKYNFTDYEKLRGDLSNYYNGLHNLFKSKYIQEHLVDGFEDILETDTGEQAYEKNKRNQERAKLNRSKYDIQYRLDHWQEDYNDRMENDKNFRREMLWKYGRGEVANTNRYNSKEGQDEVSDLNDQLAKLNESLEKINGKTYLEDAKSIQTKFNKIKAGETVVSAEEFDKINKYSTTGDAIYNQVKEKLEQERRDAFKKTEGLLQQNLKTDGQIQSEAEAAMHKYMKEDIWQSLMKDLIAGKRSAQEARYILDQQGLGDFITNEQLLNIKKNKKFGENLIQTVNEVDKSGNVITKFLDAEGKVIQREDYDRDESGKIKVDKKGKPIKKKRDVTLDDSEDMETLMKRLQALQNVQGTGAGDVTMKIDTFMGGGRKNLSMYSDGENMFYYDPETGDKYDTKGQYIGKWNSYGLPSMASPQLVSQAQHLQQANFVKRLNQRDANGKLIGYSLGTETFTSENTKVNTKELDMSKFETQEAMLQFAKSLLGDAFTEKLKNELADQYNNNKNAKIEMTTFRKGNQIMSGAFVNGQWTLFPDDQLAAKELNAMEQHAKKLGFSSEEAKIYADNQFRQQSSWAEIQKRMSAENISIEGVIATSLDGISQQLVTIQNKIGVMPGNFGRGPLLPQYQDQNNTGTGGGGGSTGTDYSGYYTTSNYLGPR